jgi:hypothetical protein
VAQVLAAACYGDLSEPILTFAESLQQKGADLLLSDTYQPFISADLTDRFP